MIDDLVDPKKRRSYEEAARASDQAYEDGRHGYEHARGASDQAYEDGKYGYDNALRRIKRETDD